MVDEVLVFMDLVVRVVEVIMQIEINSQVWFYVLCVLNVQGVVVVVLDCMQVVFVVGYGVVIKQVRCGCVLQICNVVKDIRIFRVLSEQVVDINFFVFKVNFEYVIVGGVFGDIFDLEEVLIQLVFVMEMVWVDDQVVVVVISICVQEYSERWEFSVVQRILIGGLRCVGNFELS